MSDNEEQTYGFDARPILDTFDKAINVAQRQRQLVINEADENFMEARKSVRKVLAHTRHLADNIIDMIQNLDRDNPLRTGAESTYRAAVEKAEAERDEALSADPFTEFIAETVGPDYSWGYADTVFANAPLTVISLKELAKRECWCPDYEYVVNQAVKAGVLPGTTVEVHREVPYHRVPSSYNAEEGERWEAVGRVPVAMRHESASRFTHSMLLNYAVGDVTYVKVDDNPTD
jgi:hypothetical protein